MLSIKNLITQYHDCTADSRFVQANDIFMAIKGLTHDGTQYIDDAVKNGARLVIGQHQLPSCPIEYMQVENIRQYHATLKKAFYPFAMQNITAITGTNGKTSCAHFLQQLWHLQHYHSASIGTLGCYISTPKQQYWHNQQSLTSPAPDILYPLLHALHQQHITHLAIEASSHGLDQHRLDGLQVDVALLSSFSHDHLDYHKTMAHYGAAKLRLFTDLCKKDGMMIWHKNVALHDALYKQAKASKRRYCIIGEQVVVKQHSYEPTGQNVMVQYYGKEYQFFLPLLGRFQLDNFLLCLSAVYSEGGLPHNIANIAAQIQGVKGRMEYIKNPKNYNILVDYAHTPDALKAVLLALKAHTYGRLIVVFGCGGNRDTSKRPLMGAVAEKMADIVIVTDDNPRDEAPSTIREAIIQGAPNALNIGARQEAITHAIDICTKDDIIVIAGKGHEQGQVIGNITHPFCDQDVVQAYFTGEGAQQ